MLIMNEGAQCISYRLARARVSAYVSPREEFSVLVLTKCAGGGNRNQISGVDEWQWGRKRKRKRAKKGMP